MDRRAGEGDGPRGSGVSHPHVRQTDRDAIEDRGLIDGDNTPDMRKGSAATEPLQFKNPTHPEMQGEVQ